MNFMDLTDFSDKESEYSEAEPIGYNLPMMLMWTLIIDSDFPHPILPLGSKYQNERDYIAHVEDIIPTLVLRAS